MEKESKIEKKKTIKQRELAECLHGERCRIKRNYQIDFFRQKPIRKRETIS